MHPKFIATQDADGRIVEIRKPSPEKLGELLHHVFIPWEARPPVLYAHSQEIVRCLSEAGADMDHRDIHGHTLLHYLSYHNQCGCDAMGTEPIKVAYCDLTVIPAEVHRKFLDLAETILECGADPLLPPSALAQAMGNQQLVDLLSRQRDSH